MKYWYNKSPSLFQKFKRLLKDEYPSLHIQIENNIIYIRGTLFLYNKEKTKEIDHYSVEIEIPNDYPEAIPLVREIGGRLPKIADRHLNSDGTACLFYPEERLSVYPTNSTIIDFIKGPVYKFFLEQTYFDLTAKRDGKGIWLYGEWKHGEDGAIEFYSEKLDINIRNKEELLKILRNYVTKEEIKGHWDCYCGSEKK